MHSYSPFATVPPSLEEAVAGAPDIETFEQYEVDVHSTVTSPIAGERGEGKNWFSHLAFKLAGEAGEFAEHVGKAQRDDGFDITDLTALSDERRAALIKELGDILWYVTVLSCLLGLNLLGVARVNVFKRRGRKERGALQGSGDNR